MSGTGEFERSEPIDVPGVRHAPENEAGVVLLFAKTHKRLGFPIIDKIQEGFPDCWAFQHTLRGTRRVWIEFEFRSRGFRSHLKSHARQLKMIRPKRGYVVCWENDWPECRRYVEVLELRSSLGSGFRVWVQAARPKYQTGLDEAPRRRKNEWSWTVHGRARPGDLVLMWRAGTPSEARRYEVDPDLLQSFANIYEVTSLPRRDRKWGWTANVRQIALLQKPLRLGALRADPILRETSWMKGNLQGRKDVTPYWWRFYDLVVRLNPALKNDEKLKRYRPDLP